jgi:hypothetical protein
MVLRARRERSDSAVTAPSRPVFPDNRQPPRRAIADAGHVLRILARTAKLLIVLHCDETLQKDAELIRNHNIVFFSLPDMPANATVGDLDEDKPAELIRPEGVDEQSVIWLAPLVEASSHSGPRTGRLGRC